MSGLTKIFIVLSLVFNVALSVLIVLFISKQEPYKMMLDSANTGLVASSATVASLKEQMQGAEAALAKAKDDLNKAVADGQAAAVAASKNNSTLTLANQAGEARVTTLQTQVTSLTTTVQTLKDLVAAKDAQLGDVGPKVSTLTRENSELGRRNNEMDNQLRAAEQAMRRLQEQLASLEAAPKTGGGTSAAIGEAGGQVTSLSVSNQTAVTINGQISNIGQSAGRTLIETKLGSRDGVKVGTRFAISRGNSYLADAVVQTVTPDQSVAVIVTPIKQGQTIQPGDLVMSGQ